MKGPNLNPKGKNPASGAHTVTKLKEVARDTLINPQDEATTPSEAVEAMKLSSQTELTQLAIRITQLESELKVHHTELEAKFVKEIADLKIELVKEIADLKTELGNRIEKLEFGEKVTRWAFAAAGALTTLILRELLPRLLTYFQGG